MVKGSTIAKIIVAILFAALLIATVVLSALVLVKVLDKKNQRQRDGETTTAATPARPVVTTSAEIGTTAAGTTPVVTATSTTALYPFGYTYEGQFTDRKSPWDHYLSNPYAYEFLKQRDEYGKKIQALLDQAFRNAYAYVAYFGNDANHIRVYFAVTVSNATNPQAPSAKSLQIELEKRAADSGYDWGLMVIQNLGQQTPAPVSQSQGWKDAAQMFSNSMDTSFDPCDNFYAFACNNWIKNHPLNETTSAVSYFSLLQDTINFRMIQLLQTAPPTSGPESLQTAALLYRSCLSSQSSEYEGAKKLLAVLNSLGGWPVIAANSSWNPPPPPYDNFGYLMGVLVNTYGVPSLLSPLVDIDWRNVSRHRLFLDQASLTIPASIYHTQPDVARTLLLRTISNAAYALLYGVEVDPEIFGKDVQDMVDLEYTLAMISVLPDDQRNQSSLYNPYTVPSAGEQWPKIDWKTYLDALATNHSVSKESLEAFIIREPSYQTALNDLVYLYSSIPEGAGVRVLQNWILWRFVAQFQMFGGPPFYEIFAELKQKIKPERDSLPPPPADCAGLVQGFLPWAIGRLYVDRYFSDQERMRSGIMVSIILSSFRGQLSGLPWMDDRSKLRSINKIYNLVKNVGYPDFLKDDAQLDAYYESINRKILPNPDTDFMDFFLALIDFQWDKSMRQLDAAPDRTDFSAGPTTVNAWYQPERNSITLPAAILNPPFFRSDFPMAVNYGGMGAVMGHELTHGFDDQGVQYDYNGTLNDWMSAYSDQGFAAMATCAVDQYSSYCYNFSDSERCLNGRATQGENIADNGGIKAAYQAYKAYVASNGEEFRLPQMESFTMDQIFFLSYGNVWCSAQTDEVLASQIITDEHSPAKSRVNGTLQNFEPFAAAFGCRPGDRMYPVKHCKIW